MNAYIRSALCIVIILFSASTVLGAVVGRQVEYRAGSSVFKGFLAENAALKEKRPAVLVVHEWWGNNEYARKRAMMLAELGYIALAVDMYGNGKIAQHPDDALQFSSEVMKDKRLREERFNAALAFIRQQPMVDSGRIAAVGYCFGGAVVLQMARSGSDLKGVASFHGTLATDSPALPGEVKVNILVLNGEKDALVPPQQVQEFLDEMTLSGAPFRYVGYMGAKHGFTNPDAGIYAQKFGLPLAYDKRADQNSWAELQQFLNEIFKKAQ